MFSWNHQNHPRLRNVLERMFTFSFPIYMALISGIMHHVFSLWCSYVLEHEVYTIYYKNGHFYQCTDKNVIEQSAGNLTMIGDIVSDDIDTIVVNELDGSDSYSFNQTDEKVTNLRNYSSEISSYYKSQFLLLACLIFLLFHLIESLTNCNNGVASLSNFIKGQQSQEFSNKSEPEKGIEMDELDPEEVEQMLRVDILVPNLNPKSKSKCSVMMVRGMMSLIGFALIVILYLSPMAFHLLNISTEEIGKPVFYI